MAPGPALPCVRIVPGYILRLAAVRSAMPARIVLHSIIDGTLSTDDERHHSRTTMSLDLN